MTSGRRWRWRCSCTAADTGTTPQASLAALRVEPEVRQNLSGLGDPDVQASVTSLLLATPTRNGAPEAALAAMGEVGWALVHAA
jgi:hypothetical protein